MHVGIDVGTRACLASIVDEQGGIKKCLEFANEESGWHLLLQELSAEDQVVLEASTAAYPIHDFFLRQGFRVVMANPSKIRAIIIVYGMLTRGERCRWEDRHLTHLKVRNMRRACERKVFEG